MSIPAEQVGPSGPVSGEDGYLALLEALAEKAAEWRELSGGTLTVPFAAHLAAVNALCDALDAIQNFREARR